MSARALLVWGALLLLPCSVRAETGLELHGSVQTDLSAWLPGKLQSWDPTGSGSSLFTLNARNTNRELAAVDGTLYLTTYYGAVAELLSLAQGVTPTSTTPVPLALELRRLSVTLHLPRVDILLGRQLVNLGQGMVYSPIDVFSSVELLELSMRRRGSDAVRLRMPLGDLGGIELVAGLPANAVAEKPFAMKLFGSVFGWDVAGVMLQRMEAEETLLGLTVKGDLVAGVTGELVPRYQAAAEAWRLEAMLGADWSFEGLLFLNAEYYYRDPELPAQSFYDEHNLMVALRVSVDDFSSVSASALMALPREDVLFTLQYQTALVQNADAVVFYRIYELEALKAVLPARELGVRVTVKF